MPSYDVHNFDKIHVYVASNNLVSICQIL